MNNTRWMGWIASGLIVSVSALPSVAQTQSNLTQLFPALVGVQLTPKQQQLWSLSQQTLPQLRSVLTPEQQIQFNTALTQGKSVRVAALSLNLSATQRFQILNILKTTRSQLATILTPSQLQTVQQNIKNRQLSGR